MLLRLRVILATVIAMGAVGLVVAAAGLYALNIYSEQYKALSLSTDNQLLSKIVDGIDKDMRVALPTLARNQDLKNALSKQQWEMIPEAVRTNYNALKGAATIDYMRILDSNRKILSADGDDTEIGAVSRVTVTDMAFEQNSVVSGFVVSDNGKLVIAVASPITKRGKAIGMILLERNLAYGFNTMKKETGIESVLLGDKGEPLIETTNGIFDGLANALGADQSVGNTVAAVGDITYQVNVRPFTLVDGSDAGAWITLRDITTQQVEFNNLKAISLAGLVIVLIALIIGMYIFMKHTLQPLQNIAGVMARLTTGERDIKIIPPVRQDEIGAITNAVVLFQEHMLESERLVAEDKRRQEKDLQRAVLNERLIEDFETLIGQSIASFSQEVDVLRSAVSDLEKVSVETGAIANKVTHTAENTSSNVTTVSTAAEELTGSINEISHQVQQSVQVVDDASGMASDTEEKIRKLADDAQEISDVVQIITDIAEQTNILALNATIEAARAGEAGKGFAVVANEVKGLASQTAKATDKITLQIDGIQSASTTAVNGITRISLAVRSIKEVASAIAAAVKEQEAATHEIARNIQQAANGAEELISHVGEVRESTVETKTVSDSISISTTGVADNTEKVKAAVNQFLSDVEYNQTS